MGNDSTALRIFRQDRMAQRCCKSCDYDARGKNIDGQLRYPGIFLCLDQHNSNNRRREFRLLLLCMTEKLSMDLRVRYIVATPDHIMP